MSRILLGTRNEGKIAELRDLLAGLGGLELLTQSDVPFPEVDETGVTFLENALLKAHRIGDETGIPVLAEDAGLEVSALGGAPGVRSARYAGEPVDFARNTERLLEQMEGTDDRRARFVSVVAVRLPDEQIFVATGVLRGRIARTPSGTGGFGYDPVFVPDGETRTLAELSLRDKNRISHRRRAAGRIRGILADLLSTGEL